MSRKKKKIPLIPLIGVLISLSLAASAVWLYRESAKSSIPRADGLPHELPFFPDAEYKKNWRMTLTPSFSLQLKAIYLTSAPFDTVLKYFKTEIQPPGYIKEESNASASTPLRFASGRAYATKENRWWIHISDSFLDEDHHPPHLTRGKIKIEYFYEYVPGKLFTN